MAKTLLNGVNDVLKKVQIVSDGSLLTSLSNSGKQTFIDAAVSAWGEAVDQIYSKSRIMRPNAAEEGSITLVADQRTYELECDLVKLSWPLQDRTNGRFVHQYPGGYEELINVLVQPENYTGQPNSGAINPIDGTLYLDTLPTSSEAGDIYTYTYLKDLTLSRASDRFPFSDTVYRALVPVVAEVYRYYQYNKYTTDIAKVNYGRAVRALKQQPDDPAWITRQGGVPFTSPLGYDPYRG